MPKKIYQSSEESGAPLSNAIEVNGTLYISGQIHADQDWNLIGETVEERFQAILARVEKALTEASMNFSNVVRVHLYLTDLDELHEVTEIYKKTFTHPMHARTAIGVKALPLGASIEMDVIAVRT